MSNLKTAEAFASEQVFYASIVESLRLIRLPDGRTLSEALALEGIPFFDVFAAEMAWRHMTTIKAANSIGTKLKMRAKPIVSRLKQLIADRAGTPRVSAEWLDGPVMLCLAFTGRMYRDVLEPVVRKVLRGDELRVVLISQAPMAGTQDTS